MTQVRKHYAGCYRIGLNGEVFGQVKRDGRQWLAEVRDCASGELRRYAGLWRTRQEAIAELQALYR